MKNQHRKTFFMFLLAFLVAFFIVSLVEVLRSSFMPSAAPDVQTASAISTSETIKAPTSFSELAERVKPAVVNISTTKTTAGRSFGSPFGRSPFGDDFFDRFFGDIPQREFKQRSLGSGFVISNDGYIFTNNHVVEKADKILVKLSDNREYEAKIIGTDTKTDIALIKIKPSNSLPVAEIGDSEKVRVGEWVIAIGNPFGLDQTVTAGIVSAKGRVIGAGPYDNFIQTDASINPGNSGGPLLNMAGEVVGINTAIFSQSGGNVGIGFAIPVNMAKEIAPQLKEKGHGTRGWLGVGIQKITPELSKSFGLKDEKGALVSQVVKGGPADKGGIETGDVIVEFDGNKVSDSNELPRMVAPLPVGKTVSVKLLRGGNAVDREVKIGQLEEQKEEVASDT